MTGESIADRRSKDLLYLRVCDALVGSMAKGELRAGSRLPSERSLAIRLGLSRVTVRRGLQELAGRGLIEASPGHAWFVKQAVIEGPQNALQSFTETASQRGLRATARVLSARVRPATIEESEILHVAPGAELVELVRLRLVDGIALAVDASLVPHSRAPGLLDIDFSSQGLFEVLGERFGCVPTRATYTVEAHAAGAGLAEALDLATGEPVLVTIGTTYDQDDRPLHFGRTTYRADRYRFHATRTLVTTPAGAGRPRA